MDALMLWGAMDTLLGPFAKHVGHIFIVWLSYRDVNVFVRQLMDR